MRKVSHFGLVVGVLQKEAGKRVLAGPQGTIGCRLLASVAPDKGDVVLAGGSAPGDAGTTHTGEAALSAGASGSRLLVGVGLLPR